VVEASQPDGAQVVVERVEVVIVGADLRHGSGVDEDPLLPAVVPDEVAGVEVQADAEITQAVGEDAVRPPEIVDVALLWDSPRTRRSWPVGPGTYSLRSLAVVGSHLSNRGSRADMGSRDACWSSRASCSSMKSCAARLVAVFVSTGPCRVLIE
jgi:hypothetical protein